MLFIALTIAPLVHGQEPDMINPSDDQSVPTPDVSETLPEPDVDISTQTESISAPAAEIPTPAEPTEAPKAETPSVDLTQEQTIQDVGSGGFNRSVLSLLVQKDGRVVVGGQFTMYGGVPVGRGIARLDSKASLDKTFTDNSRLTFSKGEIYALGEQPDGKILVGGNFILHGKGTDDYKFFCRFHSDGRLDESFGHLFSNGFDNNVLSLSVQPDGKVLVGGNFTTYAGHQAGGVARLYPSGELDTFFSAQTGEGIDPKGTVKSVIAQADGKILIVGDFTLFNRRKVDGVVRLNPDGSMDEEFYKTVGNSFFVGFPLLESEESEAEAGLYLSKALLQPDGHIVLGGEFISYDKEQDIYSSKVLRIDQDGNLDLDFIKKTLEHKFDGDVNAILQMNDGKILVGCSNPFSMLEPDGRHDRDFLLIAGRAIGGDINTLAIQPDGKVIVGGRFNAFKGIKVGNFVRLNPDGTMDERFVSGSYK